MTTRSRPLWPLLTAALIGLPVLYVASFGPACWLADREYLPVRPVKLAYRPLAIAVARSGAQSLLCEYGEFLESPKPYWHIGPAREIVLTGMVEANSE